MLGSKYRLIHIKNPAVFPSAFTYPLKTVFIQPVIRILNNPVSHKVKLNTSGNFRREPFGCTGFSEFPLTAKVEFQG